MDILAFIPGGE